MSSELIFSWAENADGKMVHVDSVPRGLQCGCTCPNCHEKLIARHGEIKEHGFAHHSDNRGANLRICYMVVLYKLAEQIVQTKKRIHAPSYYGIFKDADIEFEEVKIDSSFEREDKQPDVIGTTKEGKQYLVEFVFNNKVQHKRPIDYKNMTCLEVDLSSQTLETLEEFLLNSTKDRRWLNNEDYFGKIVDRYTNAGKKVRIKEETDCANCELNMTCCAVRYKNSPDIIKIENSGKFYRICKAEQYDSIIEARQRALDLKRKKEEEIRQFKEEERRLREERRKAQEDEEARRDKDERSCYNCKSNLKWMNRNGYANCGLYERLGVPRKTPPECAETCKCFKKT